MFWHFINMHVVTIWLFANAKYHGFLSLSLSKFNVNCIKCKNSRSCCKGKIFLQAVLRKTKKLNHVARIFGEFYLKFLLQLPKTMPTASVGHVCLASISFCTVCYIEIAFVHDALIEKIAFYDLTWPPWRQQSTPIVL